MKTRKLVKLFVILLTLALMIPFASCNFFNNSGSLKLESFTVDPTSVKTEYQVGEAIDFSGIKAIAKYNDETLNKEYTFAELTITYPNDITATTGTKQITVSFNDPHLGVKQETTVSITVVNKQSSKPALKLESFTVDPTSIKTEYEVGEAIDFSDIKATATYNDASLNKVYKFEELTLTYAEDITATAGTKQVVVSFMDPNLNVEQKATITVTVPVKFFSFTVDTSAVKTQYEIGEAIDFSDIKATATYNDATLNKEYTFADLTVNYADDITATSGNKQVVVSFMDPHLNVEQKANVMISVPVKVISFVVDTSSLNAQYEVGETIDFSGIKATATYNDAALNKEYTFADLTIEYAADITATEGNKKVTISVYDEETKITHTYEKTIFVAVPPKSEFLEATVDTSSLKLTYEIGEVIDFSGIKVTTRYEDASYNKEYAFADLTIVGAEDVTTTSGNKQITISFYDTYHEMERKVYVMISVPVKLLSFVVDNTSVKTQYEIGEAIDFSGIQATATYNDASLNKVYAFADLTITYANDITATTGNKQIVVSFMDPNLGVPQEATVTISVPVKFISFDVDTSLVKTEYEIGEAIDFSGIKATATYNDASLNKEYTFADLTVTYDADITATEGNKKVTVSVVDPYLGVEHKVDVTITVINSKMLVIEAFNAPESLTHFNSANKNAGTLSYGSAGFSGQFAVGGQMYVIGNQNAFKLNYSINTIDPDTDEEQNNIVNFYADVVLSLKKNGQYVELTAKEAAGNTVEYYDGDVLMATVDVYTGVYQFTAATTNTEVRISVVPSDEYYIIDHEDDPPKILEAKIINAYNVYEAWQLAVIDNVNEEWADFKTAHGIAGLNVAGIVLHNDIHLTENDVPASFFYTTDKSVVYTNSVTGETVEKPAGTKYLIDGTFIYERLGTADFAIEGNFFTLDTKDFPIVASPAVFGADAERDYGVDFSNAALFRFGSVDWTTVTPENLPADVSDVTVNNLALIGNSARDNLLDATDNLASAGGLIFFKSHAYTDAVLNNVIGNSYFITYFTEWGGDMIVKNSKCYDSYQNAAFVWSNCKFELIDSYVNGCGGPAIIAQSLIEEGWHPVVNVTGGQIETHLSGQEIWFTAVNATSMVGDIKLLGMGLQQAGLGNIADADGKMNIMSALMAKGSRADEIVTGIDAQGSILIEGKGIDRFASETNVNWAYIYQITQGAMQFNQVPPFFTVTGADGAAYTIYYNGTTFVDLAGNALGTDASHAAIVAAFMQADTVVLTQGGLSVVFEFYHY